MNSKRALYVCDANHEEIVFFGYDCPLCRAKAETRQAKAETETWKDSVKLLRETFEAKQKGGA